MTTLRKCQDALIFRGAHRIPDLQFHGVLTAVVHQGDCWRGKFFSVEKELVHIDRTSREPGDADVIDGLPVAVMNFAGGPVFRKPDVYKRQRLRQADGGLSARTL